MIYVVLLNKVYNQQSLSVIKISLFRCFRQVFTELLYVCENKLSTYRMEGDLIFFYVWEFSEFWSAVWFFINHNNVEQGKDLSLLPCTCLT